MKLNISLILFFVILSLYFKHIDAATNCNQTIIFDEEKKLHLILISNEAYEYEFNFTFSHNTSFEIGSLTYNDSEQCTLLTNIDCPMNSLIDVNLAKSIENYEVINKNMSDKAYLLVPTTCFKYKPTPFMDYIYTCKSEHKNITKETDYYNYSYQFITIFIDNINETSVTINSSQKPIYNDTELLGVTRRKCSKSPTRHTTSNNEIIVLALIGGVILIGAVLIIFFNRLKSDKENNWNKKESDWNEKESNWRDIDILDNHNGKQSYGSLYY